jgi:hypothetical protein
MLNYINELLQEVFESNNNYRLLSSEIYNYISNNNESKYMYIVDAIQIAILNHTDKFLSYQKCLDIYLTIKGFESVYNND